MKSKVYTSNQGAGKRGIIERGHRNEYDFTPPSNAVNLFVGVVCIVALVVITAIACNGATLLALF